MLIDGALFSFLSLNIENSYDGHVPMNGYFTFYITKKNVYNHDLLNFELYYYYYFWQATKIIEFMSEKKRVVFDLFFEIVIYSLFLNI
jgi:hypothetical protein